MDDNRIMYHVFDISDLVAIGSRFSSHPKAERCPVKYIQLISEYNGSKRVERHKNTLENRRALKTKLSETVEASHVLAFHTIGLNQGVFVILNHRPSSWRFDSCCSRDVHAPTPYPTRNTSYSKRHWCRRVNSREMTRPVQYHSFHFSFRLYFWFLLLWLSME